MAGSMEKSEKTRKLVLGGALTATLIIVFLIEDETEIYPIQPVQSMQTKKNYSEIELISGDTPEHLDVEQLGKRKFNARAGKIFNSTSWTIIRSENSRKQKSLLSKLAIQRVVSSPVVSKPPPLRFKYLGKITHNNQTKIILSQSGEKFVVSPGEHIDDQYRLDAMDSETVTVTYLPLNVEQTLVINNPGNKR